MKLFTLIFIFALNATALAADDCSFFSKKGIKACLELLDLAPKGPNEECTSCKAATQAQNSPPAPVVAPPPSASMNPSCKSRYDKLFADGVVNTTIAIGYNDVNGSVSDNVWGQYSYQNIVRRLTGPCPASYELSAVTNRTPDGFTMEDLINERAKGCGKRMQLNQTCGFKTTDDPEIFTKTIKDHNNRNVQVRVRIVNAEVSPSDKKNRESLSLMVNRICKDKVGAALSACSKANTPPQVSVASLENKCLPSDRFYIQICKTKYTREAFQNGITGGDEMVFYEGHARDGGGPSFEPPRVLANGHVNYSWYRRNRPGHLMETAALKAAHQKGKAPVFYGSYSCSSRLHFLDRGQLAQSSPSTAYVLSNRLAYSDETIAALLQTMNSALSKQCEAEFNQKTQEASCAFNLRRF